MRCKFRRSGLELTGFWRFKTVPVDLKTLNWFDGYMAGKLPSLFGVVDMKEMERMKNYTYKQYIYSFSFVIS